uniref:Uncharacterized protein n=1 Tax=Vespula pensylvanica TaxID=30213 RepID=A0A834JBM0_VESPE|nr:hypothetical protein H0235_018475 [Vespula pensylvanica]
MPVLENPCIHYRTRQKYPISLIFALQKKTKFLYFSVMQKLTKLSSQNISKYIKDNINLEIPLKTKNNIDQAVEVLTKLIQAAAYVTMPETKESIDAVKYLLVICEKIAEKRNAGKKWQNNKQPEDKKKLNKLIKELKGPRKHIPPIRTKDNIWARGNCDISETFAEHLSEMFKPNENPMLLIITVAL